jgi:predicted membrane-bound spermidine synthase
VENPVPKSRKQALQDEKSAGAEPMGLNAYMVVFLTSFAMLVIEVVAGRILAPHVGVSLYTWTSIIGVVLAGISAGAWLGGAVADRYPRIPALGWILFLSGLGAFSIPPMVNWMAGSSLQIGLMGRILAVTAVTFFIPPCFLGMVSPVVVKLALADLDKTGNVVGRIYAVSTLGSILGTFATGFFLISWMGTRSLLFVTGVLLLLSAPIFGGFFRQRKRIGLFLLVLPLLWPLYRHAIHPVLDQGTFFFKESNYYTIKLKGNPGDREQPLVTLYLDNLTHSCSDRDNPFRLVYRYIRCYDEVVRWQTPRRESFKALFIGGGGYTYPRYLETRYPKTEIDVVEIDPVVTEVSRKYLGISPASKIRTFNEDGRWFVMNRKGKGAYDFIFLDAFNDLSIPYHLTTREFALQLKGLLKEEGLLVTNVIDRFEKGSFLPSYIRTLEEAFGTGNVQLLTLGSREEPGGMTNRVVLTSPRKVDIEGLAGFLNSLTEDDRISYLMAQDKLQEFLRLFDPAVLTDDYVPVDNLTALNFS